MKNSRSVPRIVIQSIGGGLLLMALFTLMWNGIAENGFNGRDHYILTLVFSIFSLLFIGYGIYLFTIAKKFPKEMNDADRNLGKKSGKSYGIIFGLEGVLIAATVLLLLKFNMETYIVPAIALIVGLHFYPMAKVFNRNIDYYVATFTCIVAFIGFYMVSRSFDQKNIHALVGTGVALATSFYGFYMILTGQKYIEDKKANVDSNNL